MPKRRKMKIEDGQNAFTWPVRVAWCTARLDLKIQGLLGLVLDGQRTLLVYRRIQ